MSTVSGVFYSSIVIFFLYYNYVFIRYVSVYTWPSHTIALILASCTHIACQYSNPGIVGIRMKKPKEMSKEAEEIWSTHVSERHGNLLCPPHASWSSAVGGIVLDMDHYCPWINNTVGLMNHRYFVQFLMYSHVVCIFTIVESFIILSSTTSVSNTLIHNLAAAFLFFIFLTSMLHGQRKVFMTHVLTLDQMKGVNTGTTTWEKIFGPNILYWGFPIPHYRYIRRVGDDIVNKSLTICQEQNILAIETMTKDQNATI